MAHHEKLVIHLNGFYQPKHGWQHPINGSIGLFCEILVGSPTFFTHKSRRAIVWHQLIEDNPSWSCIWVRCKPLCLLQFACGVLNANLSSRDLAFCFFWPLRYVFYLVYL